MGGGQPVRGGVAGDRAARRAHGVRDGLPVLPGAQGRERLPDLGGAAHSARKGLRSGARWGTPSRSRAIRRGTRRESVERARSALSLLFEADGVPDVPVRIEPLNGMYGKLEGGVISIDPDGPWPGLTTLHEMGHVVDVAKSASASVLKENVGLFDAYIEAARVR